MKRLFKFYRFPDSKEEGSAASAEPFSDFPDDVEGFKDAAEAGAEPTAEEKLAAQNKADEKIEAEEEASKKKVPAGEEGKKVVKIPVANKAKADDKPGDKPAAKAADEKAKGTEAKKDDKTPAGEAAKKGADAEKGDEDADDTEFELEEPGDDTDGENDPNAETTWDTVAEQLDIDTPVDNDFGKLKEQITSRITKAREEGQQITLEKYPVEAQNFYKFLASGKTLNDFLAPLKEFDEALAMDNETIVMESLMGTGYTEDQAKNKVAMFKEKGELDDNALMLRNQVKKLRAQEESRIITDGKTLYEQQQANIKARKLAEDSALKTSIGKLTHVYGAKLSKAHTDELVKKSEVIRKRMASDPNYAAAVIAREAYGEKIVNVLKGSAYEKGRGLARKELHNTPDGGGNKGTKRTGTKQVVTGTNNGAHFDEWDAAAKGELVEK